MKDQLTTTLENSKNYTLAVVNLMPENDYNFKPTEAAWNFRELVNHIAYGIGWWQENFIEGNKTEWSPPVAKANSKESVAYLEKAYATLGNTLRKNKMNDEAVNGFHATLDHITHHRGQLVLYLRCKGITPPDYTY